MPLPAIVGGRERQVAGERQACGLQANQRVANDLTKKIKHAQGVITLKKETTLVFAAVGVLAVLAAGCQRKGGEAEPVALVSTDRYAGYEAVVVETHRESLALRQKVLRDTVDADSYWIKGNWGETIWSLAALYLNEKTDRANAWLLGSAQAYCDAMKAEAGDGVFAPGKFSGESPWAYFALTDYVRILCLFRTDSPHHPELFSSAAPSRGQRRPSGRDGPGLLGGPEARLNTEHRTLNTIPLYLDLGTLSCIARVRLNGKDLGVVWTAPWRLEITDSVRSGENQLEVEVANHWTNRIIGDAKLLPEQRFTQTNVASKGMPLQPSGLLGRVRLLTE